MELEQNAENFDWYANSLQKSIRYSKYIMSHDEKSINQDTIIYYRSNESGIGWAYILSETIFIKNAFEMLKTSGAMRQVVDKELLMSIWGAYSRMESTQQFLDMCFQIKREEVMKEVQLIMAGKPSTVPIQTFYVMALPNDMVHLCKQMSERIKETLSKLEQSKILK